jgi:hypothetical protein
MFEVSWGDRKMYLFFVFAVPMVLTLGTLAVWWNTRLMHPSPLPLGNIFPKLCAVIWEEVHNYCERNEQVPPGRNHLQWETRSNQASVCRGYIDDMASNTKLFLQVLRFEKRKIDPHKLSLQYETWETLTLRMVDEASALRWFLVKARAGLTLHSWVGVRVSWQAMETRLREYKVVEQDFVALVSMMSDEVYYTMLVERLGLSNWRLIYGGGSSETPAS